MSNIRGKFQRKEICDFFEGKIKYIFLLLLGIFCVMIRSSPFGLSYKLNLFFILERIPLLETLGVIKIPGWEIVSLRVVPLFIFKVLHILFGPEYIVFYLYQGIVLGILGITIYFFLDVFLEISNCEKITISSISIISPGVLASAWAGSLEVLGSVFIILSLIFHKKLLEKKKLDRHAVIFIFLFLSTVFLATITGEVVLAFSLAILFSYSLYLLETEKLKMFQLIPLLISFLIIFGITIFFIINIIEIVPYMINFNPVPFFQITQSQIENLILSQPTQFLFSMGFGGVLILVTYSAFLLSSKYKKIVPLLMLPVLIMFFLARPIRFTSTSLANEIYLLGSYSVPVMVFLFLFSLSVIILKTKCIDRFFSMIIISSMMIIIITALYLNPKGGQGVGPRHYSIVIPFLIFTLLISLKKLKGRINKFKGFEKICLKIIVIFSVISLAFYFTSSIITFSQKTKTNSLIHRKVKTKLAQRGLTNSSILYQLPGVSSDFKTNFAYFSNNDIKDNLELTKWSDATCKNLKEKNYLYRISTFIDDSKPLMGYDSNKYFYGELDRSNLIYNRTIEYTYIHPWLINYPKMTLMGRPVITTHTQIGEIYYLNKSRIC